MSLGGLLFSGKVWGVDLEEKGGGEEDWEEWREGKLQLECNV